MAIDIHHQLHGYRGGHQLLRSSVRLERIDQDVVDHLSDLAGPLRPGEEFGSYISGYPLPSGDYYAMARTEQDRNAPRAGCVLTTTLLLPMGYWENEASPFRIANLLKDPATSEPIEIHHDRFVCALDPMDDPVIDELVEALFLEEKRAIVVFGTSQAEELALRVMTALWPRMRRSFSVCTFALSPRTLLGKPFELVFSPRSVRSRFAEWDGRRIEGTLRKRSDRHRWSSLLAMRIFGNSPPHLTDDDTIRVFGRDSDGGSAGTLRLYLRWEELRKLVRRSPTAMLGLIDIANSREGSDTAWGRVESVVAEGVNTAVATLAVDDTWVLLITMLKKLRDRVLADGVVESIRKAVARLTDRDWSKALMWVSEESWIDSELGDIILRLVGRRVASENTAETTRKLASVPPDRLVKMVLLEKRLLRRMFRTTEHNLDVLLIRNLTDGIRGLASDGRRRTLLPFLRHIRGDIDSGLLREILKDTSGDELAHVVNIIWSLKARRTAALGEIICAAAEASNRVDEVREAFAKFASDNNTDRCVSRLLTFVERDVRWLLESSDIGDRRRIFLGGLIDEASNDDLERVFGQVDSARLALQVLVDDLTVCWVSAARVVSLAGVSAVDRVEFGLKILPKVCGEEASQLARLMAVSALTEDSLYSIEMRSRVIRMVIQRIELSEVLDEVFRVECTGEQVDRTLRVIYGVRCVIGIRMAGYIKQIVDLVAKRPQFDLRMDGARALASLVESTHDGERRTYVEICSTILPFAMASRCEEASAIVVSSFPAVYDELRNGENRFWLGEFFCFFDWDRCKVARRELVRAFLASSWPPVDLGIVADRSRDPVRILRRLRKDPKGLKYLRRIEDGARQLEDNAGERIISAIREVRGREGGIEESREGHRFRGG